MNHNSANGNFYLNNGFAPVLPTCYICGESGHMRYDMRWFWLCNTKKHIAQGFLIHPETHFSVCPFCAGTGVIQDKYQMFREACSMCKGRRWFRL
ncbi:hypothetical protein LCGC14_2727740 [marine sediment metagenome]|uniref:CCHC-type domain-containing protein n=1 Tax=marine sediment metagenome TaxID=412755 RepID=A0A0F8Z8D3_9ZZZZ